MKKIIKCILIMMMLLALGGCQKNVEQEAEESYEQEHNHEHDQNAVVNLKIGLSANPDEPHYKAVEQFVKEIEAKSNGEIKATIYGSGKLGTDEELIDSVAEDAKEVDIIIADISKLTEYDSKLDICKMPFVFEDMDMAGYFMNGEIQKDAEYELSNYNMKVLAYYADGFHCLTTKQNMISNASELQGMKIATSEDSISSIAIKAMGAMTIVADSGELSQGLQQGNYDGYEGTLEFIYHNRIYQSQKYLSMTNHSFSASTFVIASSVFDQMDHEYQDIIMNAAQSSSYANTNYVQQQERDMLNDIEASGVRIGYPNLDTFWEKAEPVLRSYSSKYDSLTDRLVMWKNEQ